MFDNPSNILFPIYFLVIMAPIVFFLPEKFRKVALSVVVLVLIRFSLSLLWGPPSEAVTVFKDFMGLESVGIDAFYFTVHPHGRMAAFCFALVGALSVLYGISVAKPSEQALSLVGIASALGVSFAGDFITFFIFWEALTFSAGGLILLHKTPEAIKAGSRFLVFQIFGGLVLLFGILQHYAVSGSFMIDIPQAGLYFFIIGIGIKCAFILVHFWLPWAYPIASFPISVVLSALSTKAALYALSRVIADTNMFVVYVGASMTIYGFTMALAQKDLRKLLSFHIISQVGYMVAGVGLATAQSVDGALLHLFNHMLYKGLLFMAAGSVLYAFNTENVYDLKGSPEKPPVWKVLPIPTFAAVCGSLAIAGTPFFNGFVSKYLLKYSFAEVNPAGTLLLIASVGTVISFCKFLYFGFFKARANAVRMPTFTMNLSMITVALGTILLGVYPKIIHDILPYASKLPYYTATSMWGSLQFILYGTVIFIILRKFLDPSNKPKIYKMLATDPFWNFLGPAAYKVANAVNWFDQNLNNFYALSSKFTQGIVYILGNFEKFVMAFYEFDSKNLRKAVDMSANIEDKLASMYEGSTGMSDAIISADEKFKKRKLIGWNIKNINIAAMIMAFLISMFLFVFFYYSTFR